MKQPLENRDTWTERGAVVKRYESVAGCVRRGSGPSESQLDGSISFVSHHATRSATVVQMGQFIAITVASRAVGIVLCMPVGLALWAVLGESHFILRLAGLLACIGVGGVFFAHDPNGQTFARNFAYSIGLLSVDLPASACPFCLSVPVLVAELSVERRWINRAIYLGVALVFSLLVPMSLGLANPKVLFLGGIMSMLFFTAWLAANATFGRKLSRLRSPGTCSPAPASSGSSHRCGQRHPTTPALRTALQHALAALGELSSISQPGIIQGINLTQTGDKTHQQESPRLERISSSSGIETNRARAQSRSDGARARHRTRRRATRRSCVTKHIRRLPLVGHTFALLTDYEHEHRFAEHEHDVDRWGIPNGRSSLRSKTLSSASIVETVARTIHALEMRG